MSPIKFSLLLLSKKLLDRLSNNGKYLIILTILASINVNFAQLPDDRIKELIKLEIARKRSKSIVVGIIDAKGRRILSEGVISDESTVPPNGDTVYEIGSITKVFTSLVLAQMSLQHRLDLNDPISKFLPPITKSPKTNGREITLLNLSIHTSTFPRFPSNVDPQDLDNSYADYKVEQLYEYISQFEPDMEIGSKWRYSNTAYGLLGKILTIKAQKKTYEELIKQKVCLPLKMNGTVISLTPALIKRTATGHSEYGAPVKPLELGAIEGGGAFRSTANDLLSFAAANLGLIESDLLPAMKITHLKQIKKELNGLDYATMGWTLRDQDGKHILFKDGGTPGFRTFLGIDKRNKFGVVVLSNSDNSVTDLGLHIIDPASNQINPFRYNWDLLDALRIKVKDQDVDAGIELYRELKKSRNPQYVFDEKQLNYLGNELRRKNKINDAIKIFELNLSEYPKSPLVYESLGEIYKRYKDKNKARDYFEKARQLEPQNPHWSFILNKLKGY